MARRWHPCLGLPRGEGLLSKQAIVDRLEMVAVPLGIDSELDCERRESAGPAPRTCLIGRSRSPRVLVENCGPVVVVLPGWMGRR